MVLHLCHNPECSKISHLYLGNAKDNFEDMIDSERSQWHKNPDRLKIIEQIKEMLSKKISNTHIAKKLGIKVGAVSYVKSRYMS
jgi:hypothetical protein